MKSKTKIDNSEPIAAFDKIPIAGNRYWLTTVLGDYPGRRRLIEVTNVSRSTLEYVEVETGEIGRIEFAIWSGRSS